MKKSRQRLWQLLLILIWGGIIVLCICFRKDITPEHILRFTPENPVLAALAMLCLFALKSVSIVIYSGILYTVSGLLFPLPGAILVNLAGTVVMVSIPYAIGRKMGGPAVEYILNKYPKFGTLRNFRRNNEFIFSYLIRMVGRLPSDVVSLYMGAIGVSVRWYLLGSFLGMLPHTVTFSVMGTNLDDISSPAFILSACAEIAILLGSLLAWYLIRRRKKEQPQNGGNTE